MATQKETRLQKAIQKAIRKKWKRSWVVKYHGDEMAKAGVQDLYGCIESFAFAIEVKLPGKKATPIQQTEIDDFNYAEGISFVATSVDEAIRGLKKGLRKRKNVT